MAPESDQLSQDIREIKWHQEAIDGSMELLIRANKKSILGEILSFFGDARRRAEVYLAIDEQRTVSGIADLLHMKGSNVSRELSLLKDFGLIAIAKLTESSIVYTKRRIDRILSLSKELRQKFDLKVSMGEAAEPTSHNNVGSST